MKKTYTKKLTVLFGFLLAMCVFVGGCQDVKSPTIDINTLYTTTNIVDVAIIGSGPAGLGAAIYSVWGNYKTLVIYGPLPGGLLTQTSLVENWPGTRMIQGPKIINNLEDQVKGLSTKLGKDGKPLAEFLADTVVSVDLNKWPYQLQTKKGITINALSIIIATGANPKYLGVPGEQDYFKRGVSTCATCDGGFLNKEDEIVVVGGGDSAIEEAMQLARHVKKVTILVRKNEMRAAPAMKGKLRDYPSIEVIYNVEVKKVLGNAERVTEVELFNNNTGTTSTFKTSAVFLAIGHTPNSDVFKRQLEIDKRGYIVLKGHQSQATSVRGVFAAGEVEDDAYRQASVALGHGVQAFFGAKNFLNEIGYTPEISSKLSNNFFTIGTVQSKELKDIPVITSEAEFEQLKKQSGVKVIDAYGENCGPCKTMAEIFGVVAHKFQEKAKFAKINTSKVRSLAEKLHVHHVPTLLIYQDDTLIAQYQGVMEEKDFSDLMEQVLSAPQ